MPFPFLAAATALAPIVGGLIQGRHNKSLARFQNAYNHPAAQMKRFKQAGLNPNLVYTQGNPGNMTPITPTNWQSAVGDAPARYTQSELQQTQADVGHQKISESQTKQELMDAQTDLIKANPYLNPEMVKSMVKQANALAGQADNKFKWESTMETYQTGEGQFTIMPRGLHKFLGEIDLIDQRYRLGEADLKTKGEILESMDFKNSMNDVIEKYIETGTINGDSVRMFLAVLFQRFR